MTPARVARWHRSIQVLICNQQKLFRDGLTALFAKGDPIKIVGEAATARTVVDQVQELRPNVVLLDAELPDATCLDTMLRILAIDPSIRIFIMALSGGHRAQIARCLAAGACAEIGRKVPPYQLEAAILAAVGRRTPARAGTSENRRFAAAHRGYERM